MPSVRLIATAVASASSSVSPRHVTCPILRPRRGSRLPYRCSFARGCASTLAPVGLARRLRAAVEPDVAEQVQHHRGRVLRRVAERQRRQDARLLLELRRHARVDRVVAAVVRARRDLVDEQRAVRARRTARRRARRGNRARRRCRSRWRALRPRRRRRCAPARSRRRECRRGAGSRRPATSTTLPSLVARDDHRQLGREIDASARARTAALPSRRTPRDVVARRHADLALAVVAEARALDDAGQQRVVDVAATSAALRSTANGATAKPWPARNVFSLIRSCAIATLAAPGVTRAFAGEEFERRRRHVLELGRRRDAQRARARRAPADRGSRPPDADRRRCRRGCRVAGIEHEHA